MATSRPAKFDPSTVDCARLLLRSLIDELGDEPSTLRDAMEDELAIQVELWATSHPANVEMYADEASSAWIALGMVAWMQMRASTREVCRLIGKPFARRAEKYANTLVDMAVITGDWWWACTELRTYIEKELCE